MKNVIVGVLTVVLISLVYCALYGIGCLSVGRGNPSELITAGALVAILFLFCLLLLYYLGYFVIKNFFPKNPRG